MGAGLAWYSREETTWKGFQASLLETHPVRLEESTSPGWYPQ